MIPARVWGGSLLLGALACSGGDDPGTGPDRDYPGTGPGPGPGGGGATTSAIDVQDNFFSPEATTVVPGTTVTWTWRGTQLHDIHFAEGQGSARQSSGTFSRTFASAGTYSYHCQVHGTAMSGSVIVK